MDDIHSLLLNLLSNVIWVPVGMVAAWLAYFLGVRLPHKRLWRLTDPSKLTVCASNSTNTNTGVYSRPSTGIGQVRAIALAINSLNAAYIEHVLEKGSTIDPSVLLTCLDKTVASQGFTCEKDATRPLSFLLIIHSFWLPSFHWHAFFHIAQQLFGCFIRAHLGIPGIVRTLIHL